MKNLITTLLLALVCMTNAAADNFAYLYIQGDKQTPFYVKLEEAMQPRYGKNYCIIPKLASGPAHIEILFQQNAFPAQRFTVLIPEGGSRGFLLVKKDDDFFLYDLQQGFYLPADNKEEDDRLPIDTKTTAANTAPVALPVAVPASAINEPAITPERVIEKPEPSDKKAIQKTSEPVVQKPEASGDSPAFIRDLELPKSEHSTAGDSSVATPSSGNAPASGNTTTVITNSDCLAPVSSAAFGKIFTALSGYTADEERLEYLNGQMNVCYETWQARTLAEKLGGDAARYQLLKTIYPRITDQASFPLLDDLLTTDAWKAAFTRLVHH